MSIAGTSAEAVSAIPAVAARAAEDVAPEADISIHKYIKIPERNTRFNFGINDAMTQFVVLKSHLDSQPHEKDLQRMAGIISSFVPELISNLSKICAQYLHPTLRVDLKTWCPAMKTIAQNAQNNPPMGKKEAEKNILFSSFTTVFDKLCDIPLLMCSPIIDPASRMNEIKLLCYHAWYANNQAPPIRRYLFIQCAYDQRLSTGQIEQWHDFGVSRCTALRTYLLIVPLNLDNSCRVEEIALLLVDPIWGPENYRNEKNIRDQDREPLMEQARASFSELIPQAARAALYRQQSDAPANNTSPHSCSVQ